MVILAIDPGHSTGIVAIADLRIMLTLQVEASIILESGLMESILTSINPALVAIEQPPGLHTDSHLLVKVFHKILDLTAEKYTLRLINPGLWKPITGRNKPALGDHIKDAYGLALYCRMLAEKENKV